jgi:beta-glucosidase
MSRAHRDTSLIISRKSLVLAKNDNSTLPLAPTAKIFVTGTYANQVRLGVTGSPEPSPDPSFASVSPLKGITAAATRKGGSVVASQALADVVVVVVGVAGEDEGSDRPLLSISPTTDNALVTSAKTAGKKVVTIFTGGSAATKEAWYTDAGAVVVGFYPGEEQGIAIAELLYGDINPSGKLSCSFPETESDLWLFQPTATTVRYPGADTGVGYRWYEKTGKKMFLPFGHGLSYTTYSYGQITVTPSNPHIYDDIEVSVPITNTGDRDGDEIAQLYISDLSPVANHPRCVKDLRGFARVNIPKKTAKTVTFKLKMREFAYYNTDKKKFMVHPGQYKIMVGPSSINLPVLATKTITLAD